ncbi:hypothetical protein [Streptomyces rubradiris]|uniref:SH3 domain-containing protein n=1 Tax=Streptomyces rubradiris TaxID=285531 RepID=A0ABQ3R4F8_STRRR|nr:hypothetical protein [Streptomyces rubradiris]GHH05960.1 hypothetical protein GCM10018792_24910 [Streptomyces rubradiris]GHI50739.1 hypothetical protein Srubr_05850 [Streptomyces rubradiris]
MTKRKTPALKLAAVLGTALLASAFASPSASASAASAAALSSASAAVPPAVAVRACETGGPHTDFKGTNINMRSTPGGNYVGTANQGDCAYWYQTDSGPRVRCPGGSSTTAWQLVQNKRTGVVGYVSACYL